MIRRELEMAVFANKELAVRILCAYYDEEDKIAYLFYVPTFEEMCIEKTHICRMVKPSVQLVDIRDLIYLDIMREHLADAPVRYLDSKHAYLLEEIFKNPKEGVVMTVRQYMNTSSPTEFLDKLTCTQTKALAAIIKEIGKEGNISLSKMVTKYKFSRPTFDGVLTKLRENHVAEVVPQGVKGTKIKFLDISILKEFVKDED